MRFRTRCDDRAEWPKRGPAASPGKPGSRTGRAATRGVTDRRSWERSPNVEQASRASRCASSPGTLGCVNVSGGVVEGGSSAPAESVAWGYEIARLSSRAAAVLGARGGVREQENSMTFHLDWLKTGRAPRGTPRRRGPRRRLVAMGLIAGLALIQAGCQSGPFSNCGGCGSCGFFKRATDRVLHRDGGCCGSGAVGGSAVEYGAPSTVVSAPSAARAGVRAGAGVGLGALGRAAVARHSDESRAGPQGADRSAAQRRPCHDRFRGQADGLLPRQSPTKTAVRLDSGPPAEAAPAARPRRSPAEPTPATTTIRSTTCRRSACPAR